MRFQILEKTVRNLFGECNGELARREKKSFNSLISKYRIPIMGLSMISIMLYHQNWITEGFFFEWIRMLGYIGVEVFLFISGFGIAHSLMKNTLWQYYKNRVIRLMPACILFGLCKIVLSNIPTMPPVQNLFLDLFSLSQWYIYAIVVFYLFAPVVYKMINKVGGFFLW